MSNEQPLIYPENGTAYDRWMYYWERMSLRWRAETMPTKGIGDEIFNTPSPPPEAWGAAPEFSPEQPPVPGKPWRIVDRNGRELKIPAPKKPWEVFIPEERLLILQDARALLLATDLTDEQKTVLARLKEWNLLPQIPAIHAQMRDHFGNIYSQDLSDYWQERPLYDFIAALPSSWEREKKLSFITASIISALTKEWYPQPSKFAAAEAPYFFQAMQKTFTRGGAERQEFLGWLLLRFARTEPPDAAASPDSIIEKLAPCLKIYCQAVGDKYLAGSFLREFTAAVQAQRMLPKDFPFHTMAATIRDARGPR
jgi:hypothetical protein